MEEKKKTRVPKCGYCRNHGMKMPIRAHKRDCKYFDCQCRLCFNTREKREHMSDMQYIKRNGVLELERIQNDGDAQAKKEDVFARIYKERMANKSKKRMMKDLKNGNGSQDFSFIESTEAPLTLKRDQPLLPGQLTALTNLGAVANNNPFDYLPKPKLTPDPTNLELETLANIYRSGIVSQATTTTSPDNSFNDQFLKTAKLLGIGINPQVNSTVNNSAVLNNLNAARSSAPFNDRNNAHFCNEEPDISEITKFIERLNIGKSLNNDEKVLNSAICILFNGIPLALLNPGNVAEEIYSIFKQLNSAKVFR